MAEISNSTGFGKHFLSLLGQSSSFNTAYNIAQVALTWYIFTLTGSAVIVGLAAIVESVAVLIVSLPVGAIVDRSNKGFLIFISGIFGFIAMLSLTGIAFYRSFNLYFILGIAALWGISREISRSTSFSSLPDLVSRAIQSRVNGIYRAVNSTMGSVANALAGGIIVVFGIVASFSISTAAYLISAAFSFIFLFPFYRSRPPARNKSAERAESMVKELKEGFHWLVSRKGFFLLTLSATFFNFFMSMTFTYFVVYVARGLFADSLIYGLLLAVFAAGDVAGSLIPGRVDLLRHTGKINIVIFGGVDGLCILLMG
ncbi:MAG: MFS transporter, partial [Candidatus Thermoplasmatota archaeon]|nr:MFS transporter [Candidatus Thermoplasmatota archaeon]